MREPTWKVSRIFLWWGCFFGCLIALFQASGSLSKMGIVGLVACGSLSATVAVIEHGWCRAPYWIGTPIRTVFLLLLCWVPLTSIGWLVWPKSQQNSKHAQSFAFVIPGVTTPDNSWIFIVAHRGPEPNMNVSVGFFDEAARRMPNTTLDRMMTVLHYPEVDPKGRGSLTALEFLWKPPFFEHEKYSITVTSRERTVDEQLEIEMVDAKWYEDIKVTDRDSKVVLLDCQDIGFPTPRNVTRSCFPDVIKLQ